MKGAKFLSAIAAIGLAVSPVSAQANTRAGDHKVAYDDDDDRDGGNVGRRLGAFPRGLWVALVVGASGLGLAIALSKNANKSPGAN